jgi:hypothetical protein
MWLDRGRVSWEGHVNDPAGAGICRKEVQKCGRLRWEDAVPERCETWRCTP